ncbi:MAG: YggT family protein [Burkholderiaceae bacterium]
MLADIARLVLDIAATLLGSLLLLRAYMFWLGMPARNPLAQFAFALTDWLVRPLTRLIPRRGRIEWPALAGAALVAAVFLAALLLLVGMPFDPLAVLASAFLQLLRWALYLMMWLTILHALLSWVNPHAPIAPAMASLVRPFLAPIQRLIPPVGGIDLSPIVLIVVINVALMVIARLGF